MNDLLSYWRDHPPLHVLLGACLLKPPSQRSSASDQLAALKQTVAALGGSVAKKLPAEYRHSDDQKLKI